MVDHDEIRRWVEARGGFPAHVKATGAGDDPGILRIDYPGFSGQKSLERISWDEWFDAFEENELAFLCQDRKDHRVSRFSKLIRRADADQSGDARSGGGRASGDGRTKATAGPPSGRGHGPASRTADGGEGRSAAAARDVDEPTRLLREQHDLVRELFELVDRAEAAPRELFASLAVHLEIEELAIYPVLRSLDLPVEMYRSIEEHLLAKRLIADLVVADLDPETRGAKLDLLRREVLAHIDEEEREIFPRLEQRLDVDQRAALAQELVATMVALLEAGPDSPVEQVLSQTSEAS